MWAGMSYVLLVNTALFLMMGLDKRFAIHQKRRIPEKHLLFLGVLGGGLGGLLGMEVFRHKTRKKHFRILYSVSALIVMACFAMYWQV